MSTIRELTVSLKADTARFKTEMNKAAAGLSHLRGQSDYAGRGVMSFLSNVKGFHIAGVTIGLAAGAMYKLNQTVDEGIEIMNKLREQAEQVGMSAQSFTDLSYAAKQADVETESLTSAIDKMQKNLGEGMTGKAAQALEQMGVNFQKLQRLAPEDQFKEIAGALGQIKDINLRKSLEADIFGKQGTSLDKLLRGGAEAVGKKSAIVIDEAQAARLEKLEQRQKEVSDRWDAVTAKVGIIGENFKQKWLDAQDYFARGADMWLGRISGVQAKLWQPTAKPSEIINEEAVKRARGLSEEMERQKAMWQFATNASETVARNEWLSSQAIQKSIKDRREAMQKDIARQIKSAADAYYELALGTEKFAEASVRAAGATYEQVEALKDLQFALAQTKLRQKMEKDAKLEAFNKKQEVWQLRGELDPQLEIQRKYFRLKELYNSGELPRELFQKAANKLAGDMGSLNEDRGSAYSTNRSDLVGPDAFRDVSKPIVLLRLALEKNTAALEKQKGGIEILKPLKPPPGLGE